MWQRLTLPFLLLLLLLLSIPCHSSPLQLPLGFFNALESISFGSSATGIVTTQAIAEVEVNNKLLLTMRITDQLAGGNPDAILTLLFDVGFSSSGSLIPNIATGGCQLNPLDGQFTRPMCNLMSQLCPVSIPWSSANFDEPFSNNTYIVFDQLCGMLGTQVFACQSEGSCYASSTALPVLPTGNYVLDGQPPVFSFQGYFLSGLQFAVPTANSFS